MGEFISIYTTMKLIAVPLAGLCLATVESYEASDSPLLGTYSLETADGSFKHSGNLHMDPAALARFRDYGIQMFDIMNSVQGRSSRVARQVASDAPLLGTYSLETADGSFKHSGNLEMHPAALARFGDFGVQMFGIMNSIYGRSSGTAQVELDD